MITDETPVFPNNVVNLLELRTSLLDEQIRTFRRPLRESDPQVSAGIVAATWEPDDDSVQIMGQPLGRNEPTLQTYLITVQAFVKDFNEERGLARHSVLSKMIRSMLYRDEPLRVGLASLSVTMNDSVERSRRWGIRTQRFFSNEIDGDFLYLSTLEFWLETETV